ncbi:MAG: peptidylprolyl isomerase [Bryobacteraceae bacterium]
MVESAPKPTAEEVEAFHRTNRENFRMPEMFHAAHIVKHVNEEQSEEQAEAGIQAALADLERGVPFAEAAEIHSDCKGNGGDLGKFPPGHMVEEFEAAISALQPGERTGIFTTPFGFHIAELRAKAPGAISARRCGDAFQGRYPVGSLMPPDPPSPCCVPSKRRLAQLVTPIKASFERPRAVAGSLEDMVRLEGGRFRMGSESPEAFACDGEDPMRQVTLAGFHISRYAVSNAH